MESIVPDRPWSNSDGRLADNIVYFARALRKAGMRVGPASVKDAIEAVLVAGIGSRDDFYWTLHSVLVKRREDHLVFDEAFKLFWKSRELIEKMLAMFSPVAPDKRQKQKPRAAEYAGRPTPCSKAIARTRSRRNPRDRGRRALHLLRQRGAARQGFRADDGARDHRRQAGDRRAPAAVRHGDDAPLPAGPARPPRRSARHDARCAQHRRRPHPAEIPLARRNPSAAGRACRHFRIDEPVHAHLPAFPACAHREAAAGPYLRVRHAAHQPHPADAAPRSRRGAGRGLARRSRTGRAARASAIRSPSSTGCGRAACWGRARSCC